MEKTTKLSRLLITGPLDIDTPICVVKEILDAHGIKIDPGDIGRPDFTSRYIPLISKKSVTEITLPCKRNEMELVARFISNSAEWRSSQLMEAFTFLSHFMKPLEENIDVRQYFNNPLGLQSPEKITSLNACVVYRFCKKFKIITNPSMNINQMWTAVMMTYSSYDLLQRRVSSIIESCSVNDLVNIIMFLGKGMDDIRDLTKEEGHLVNVQRTSPVTHSMLVSIYGDLNDVVNLRGNISPTTIPGALALAALNYGIDISGSRDPIKEYRAIKASGIDAYQPIDPWLKYWYNANRSMFDLTKSFNPLFPVNYYTEETLIDMAISEGFTNSELRLSTPYESLQLSYVTETFYIGPCPGMTSDRTAISLDDIIDIPQGELLCFGVKDGKMIPISVGELASYFNSNQSFVNPLERNSVFSERAINKLKRMTNNSDEHIRLREAIRSIEVKSKERNGLVRSLYNTYSISDEIEKEYIRDAFRKLLVTSMHMRGWMGEKGEAFPIKDAPAKTGPDEIIISTKVAETLIDFETHCEKNKDIGNLIMSLPIVNYRDDTYQESNSDDVGRTIRDKIRIVKGGESEDNIFSCIRMSSNWLACSAHKYMLLIGMPAPFNVLNFTNIA